MQRIHYCFKYRFAIVVFLQNTFKMASELRGEVVIFHYKTPDKHFACSAFIWL